jgi:hypothetical protein
MGSEPSIKKPQHRIAKGSVVVAPDDSATGTCAVCGEGARLGWHKDRRHGAGGVWSCRVAQAVWDARPARRDARGAWAASPKGKVVKSGVYRRRTYGITPTEWATRLELQDHRCAIPGCDREPTCLDHDHAFDRKDPCGWRGALCSEHNLVLREGIGSRDLRLLAQYLDRHAHHATLAA